MRKRIILSILLLSIIILISLFGSGIKSTLAKAIGAETPAYVCNEEGLCATCIIEDAVCECTGDYCICGDKTVPKDECII